MLISLYDYHIFLKPKHFAFAGKIIKLQAESLNSVNIKSKKTNFFVWNSHRPLSQPFFTLFLFYLLCGIIYL